MNYEQIAIHCYNNRPNDALFASDDYWIDAITLSGINRKQASLAFAELIKLNYFHRLNGKNYILNYKYFRKYGNNKSGDV